MRVSVDSNILVYAFEPDSPRYAIAYRIMTTAFLHDCVLTNQVLGEFLKVCGTKHPARRAEARQAVSDWSLIFLVLPTGTKHLIRASEIAERHRLQFWDSLTIAVTGASETACLLTEDMQDGATINGVMLLNPFEPTNAELLDALLTPAP